MSKTAFMGVLGLIFCALMSPILAHPEFYKWVDDKGDIHFSEEYSNIPEKYRPFVEIRKIPIESSPPSIKGKPIRALTPKDSESVAHETPSWFRGVISKVDKDKRTIVVTGGGEAMVFPVPEDTKIKTDYGKKVPFAEFTDEMSVLVEYILKRKDIHTLNIKIETMSGGFPKKQELEEKEERGEKEEKEEKEKYEGPKYEGPKYEGPKYTGPKYTGPKYKGPKK